MPRSCAAPRCTFAQHWVPLCDQLASKVCIACKKYARDGSECVKDVRVCLVNRSEDIKFHVQWLLRSAQLHN